MFTPEIVELAFQTGIAAAGLAMALLAPRGFKVMGMAVQQQHIDRIMLAIRHITVAAMEDGQTDPKEVAQIALQYIRRNLSEAVAAADPSIEFIETKVKAEQQAYVN